MLLVEQARREIRQRGEEPLPLAVEPLGAELAEWGAAYHRDLPQRPVRAPLVPGAISSQLPPIPPETPEPIETIFADFDRIVPPGITHWQHPRFFAYFPANAAPASMLAEQLANAIAAQGMIWQTSPALTEIEQVMIQWLPGLEPRTGLRSPLLMAVY